MFDFYNKRRKLSKSERIYDQENREKLKKKYLNFSIFVTVGVVMVVTVVALILYMNFENGVLRTFVKSSSKNLESGGFSYHITAGINENTFMECDGEFELELSNQQLTSLYHAKYDGYEYDAVTYSRGSKAYRGNYYGGKWSVEDYTDRSFDFFDFYRDYRKGRLDTSAIIRYTGANDKFDATQLSKSIGAILKEVSSTKNLHRVLHQQINDTAQGTVISYTPDMKTLMGIIVRNIGSAYSSANEYTKFRDTVENSYENLEKVYCVVKLTIDKKGYLRNIDISYMIEGQTHFMKFEFSEFGEREIEVPDSFLAAADLQKD